MHETTCATTTRWLVSAAVEAMRERMVILLLLLHPSCSHPLLDALLLCTERRCIASMLCNQAAAELFALPNRCSCSAHLVLLDSAISPADQSVPLVIHLHSPTLVIGRTRDADMYASNTSITNTHALTHT
jgi:hypothetical protein